MVAGEVLPRPGDKEPFRYVGGDNIRGWAEGIADGGSKGGMKWMKGYVKGRTGILLDGRCEG